MTIGGEFLDWILKRRRCPFCVAPFPALKCVGFESFQCPVCESEFALDDQGELEACFRESFNSGDRNPFPKPHSSSCSNILCSNCEENQKKIVQLLHAFEPISTSKVDHRKQYELYATKLESRYPLCATCSFRVTAHLKRCEDEAGLEERRKTASSGGGWQNKLKMAQEMKNIQIFRRAVKGLFYWPDFLFQLGLIIMCVFRIHDDSQVNSKYSFDLWTDQYKIWLPLDEFSFSSCFFVASLTLFAIQFNGIAVNRRGFLALIPQLIIFVLRVAIANYMFRNSILSTQLDLNLILSLAAIGQAIIVKVGSKNAIIPVVNRRGLVNSINSVNCVNLSSSKNNVHVPIFSKSPLVPINNAMTSISSNKKGFAAYSDRHHQYFSFANQSANPTIMPWPEEPLPGKLNAAKDENRNFDMKNFYQENVAKANQNSKIQFKPTRLVSDDPLELEPMFSSFSLSDEKPKQNTISRRSKVISTSLAADKISVTTEGEKGHLPSEKNASLLIDAEILKIAYNSLLTVFLAGLRVSLMNQASLVTIVLALTFGLRGFVWPRLALKYQLVALTFAVGRLLWLAAELQDKQLASGHFGHLGMVVDLILILLR